MRNKAKHSLYNTWANMIQRCTNPNRKEYKNYGGRGITVCERWRSSFKDFASDVGDRPFGLSLDRIDNDKGYEPGNTRWATQKEQIQNSRNSILTAVDAAAKARKARTHCKRGHEFTEENVVFDAKRGIRACRLCKTALDRFYYYEKKIPIEELLYPIGKPGRKPKE